MNKVVFEDNKRVSHCIVFLLMFCVGFSCAFSVKAESRSDTVEVLLERAQNLRSSAISRADAAATRALALAQGEDDAVLEAKSFLVLGRLSKTKKEYQIALQYARSAYALIDIKLEPALGVDILNLIADAQVAIRQVDAARAAVSRALSIAEESNDSVLLYLAHNSFGNIAAKSKAYDEAIAQYLAAINYAEKIQDDGKLLKSHKNISEVYAKIDDLESFVKSRVIVLDLLKLLDDKKNMAISLEKLARACRRLGRFGEALGYAKQALTLSREQQKESRVVKLLLSISIIYRKIGAYDNALHYAAEAYSIHEKNSDINGMATAGNETGLIYTHLQQYDNARKYYERTLALPDDVLQVKSRAAALREMALIYNKEGDFDKALALANEALVHYQNIEESRGVISVRRTKGKIYAASGERNLALAEFDYAIAESKLISDYWSEASSLSSSAALLVDEHPQEAIKRVQSALLISKNISAKPISIDAYSSLISAYESLKNYKQALNYSKLRQALLEDVASDDVKRRANEMQVVLENEKKDKRLIELQRGQKIANLELQRQAAKLDLLNKENRIVTLELEKSNYIRIMLFVFIVFALVAVLFFYYRYRQKEICSRESREKELSVNDFAARLDFLGDTNERLVAVLSYDLTLPIFGLHKLTSSLEYNFFDLDDERQRSIIRNVSQHAERSNTLLLALLAWANERLRCAQPNFRDLALLPVCERVLEAVNPATKKKGVRVNINVDPGHFVVADRNMLAVVIRHLVENAIRFSEEYGLIELSSDVLLGNVCLRVSDAGVGIAKEDLATLFLETISDDSSPRSNVMMQAHLGLPLCRSLVEKNRGRLRVTSVKGQGSEFNVMLPAPK